MSSCAIIPQVLDNSGRKGDSKLFKDLLSISSRKTSIELYQKTKSDFFINTWNPKLTLDERNEPTLESLISKTNLLDKIDIDKLLKKLNKEIGHYKKGSSRISYYLNNDSNYKILLNKLNKFNDSEWGIKFKAEINRVTNPEDLNNTYINIEIVRRNSNTFYNALNTSKLEYNESLNTKLKDILANYGISVGALTELEERLGIKGVTEFDRAKTSAEGLIELIRIAKGIEGEKALPEEFSHFIIEAMGDNSLIARLLNHINDTGIAKEIIGEEYDSYVKQYNNDSLKLAKEAAGKLLAKHLFLNEALPNKPYKNLLQRVIDTIKNFFSRLNSSDIQKAIYQADKDFGDLAKDIMSGALNRSISINNITSSDKYFNLSERVSRDKKLLKNIIQTEQKRYDIYSKRNPDSKFNVSQRLFLDRLEYELQTNNELEGIYFFLDNALTTLNNLNSRLVKVQSDTTIKVSEKAKVLRDIRNYIYSYKSIIQAIRKNILDESKESDNRYEAKAKVAVDMASSLLDDLYVEYTNQAMPLFVTFIKPFIGEQIEIPFGKYKGTVKSVDELVSMADKDISFFDRWLDSMADSSDFMLKAMDQAVKQSKETSRLNTIEIKKKLENAALKLESSGIKDTEWMFEVDSEGHKTGNYISEIDYNKFRNAYKEFVNSLNLKYGENTSSVEYQRERSEWFRVNMEKIDGKSVPKKSIYNNPKFNNLTVAQKEFYNTIMAIKQELDSYLPDNYTRLLNTVKIRKDLIERVKSSSLKEGGQQIWEAIKDNFIKRSDDTDFGDKAVLLDFEGREVQSLPIYYTKLKEGESNDDISTDVVSTLTAYAAMANDYNEMNKIIDALELSRDMLRERTVTQTRGNNVLKEKINAFGQTVENTLTKSGDATRVMQRLNDFFEMQVYGRYMADEGTFGNTNIDKGKVANFVNKVTSLNTLALNVLSGVSNVITGKVMMRIESLSGEFFTESNTLRADRIYGTELPKFLAEIGNRVKVSKLALWNELFDVLQDYDTDIKNTNFDRKSWFSKMFNTSSLFFMSNAGEHWMQTRTSLALADAYKMKSPNGKIVSLWEAMEVIPVNSSNPKQGAKLQVKQGYTKEDGTEFTKQDIIAFTRKSAALNQRMHGIYNKIDRNAVQRLAIGRMGMMYRKWIKPSLNRRFKSATYNYDLQSWTEGYYVTIGRFFVQLAKELKEGQFAIAANWEQLDAREKANIKRAATEVGHFLAVALILGLIDWSDDEDRPWLVKMAEYQSRRLYTELGALIPGPQLISEGLKIVKSPAAGINTLESALDLIGLMNPFNYEVFAGEEALLQSGRYKGESKAYKLFFESPIIPMNKTLYRAIHPEESIPFYKQ